MRNVYAETNLEFAAELKKDGTIKFYYKDISGYTDNWGAGISMGDQANYVISTLSNSILSKEVSAGFTPAYNVISGISLTTDGNLHGTPISDVGVYDLKVKVKDFNNISKIATLPFTISDGSAINNNLVQHKVLSVRNYPNPFYSTTRISYNLKVVKSELVNLSIFNLDGKLVQTLVNRYQKSGLHSVVFNGTSLGCGVYYYKLSVNDIQFIGKLMLLE